MVEKIDRPDPPPSWRITEAKESREDQHQQQNPKEDQEERYRKELAGETKDWGKFGTSQIVIKPLRVPRTHIRRCLFRATSFRSGIGMLVVDVAWSDGRTTRGALVLLRQMEDYLRLKNMRAGEEVPEAFWARGTTVELGIPQRVGSARPQGRTLSGGGEEATVTGAAPRPLPAWLSALGIADRARGRINWGVVALYLFLLAMIVVAIVFEFRS